MPFGLSFKVEDIPPTTLTIFGATGDLAADYLLPALLHMETEKLLPKQFRLVCVGRRDLTTESFLEFIVKKSKLLKNKPYKNFLKHLTYYRGDFENPESFKDLVKVLGDKDLPRQGEVKAGNPHICYNRLYYFATSPQYFANIAHILKENGLLIGCAEHGRKIRILVEKPFGFNLNSAQDLNKLLLKFFEEDQIYRIDHYQGKETVQNLMVIRFANTLFEPLWNKEHISHVEISVLEEDGAKERAEHYDQTGALKDFVQNHLLQILALVAMNEPKELTTEYIAEEKLKVLDALVSETKSTIDQNVVKGQYAGYHQDIGRESITESYVALKAFVNLPRWQGVPFYLRTGKRLSKKFAEISIHFKEPVRCLFENCSHNVLTFQIQPDESVHLRINNKEPGFGVRLHQGNLDFSARSKFGEKIPSAYERLLLDFIQGDQRLFISSAETESAWKYIDSITENWRDLELHQYEPDSNGPKEAEEFAKRGNIEWWTR